MLLYVLFFFGAHMRRANHSIRTVAVLSAEANGSWPGAERFATWRRARVSCLTVGRSTPWGRTVCACAGGGEGRRRRLDLAPGRDPVGEERS
jgi:hypothetical protein